MIKEKVVKINPLVKVSELKDEVTVLVTQKETLVEALKIKEFVITNLETTHNAHINRLEIEISGYKKFIELQNSRISNYQKLISTSMLPTSKFKKFLIAVFKE